MYLVLTTRGCHRFQSDLERGDVELCYPKWGSNSEDNDPDKLTLRCVNFSALFMNMKQLKTTFSVSVVAYHSVYSSGP